MRIKHYSYMIVTPKFKTQWVKTKNTDDIGCLVPE